MNKRLLCLGSLLFTPLLLITIKAMGSGEEAGEGK
jgi:hypothetical protein